jgi:hypothetical protein
VLGLPDEIDPPDEFHFPLVLTWSLPPMPHSPDLLRLAIDLAPIGGVEMPLEVTATDSFDSPTESSERRISIVARRAISLSQVAKGEDPLCDIFDKGRNISDFLLQAADSWLG